MLKRMLGATISALTFVCTWLILPAFTVFTFLSLIATTLLSAVAWMVFGAATANAIANFAVSKLPFLNNTQVDFFSSVGKGLAVTAAGTLFSPFLTAAGALMFTAYFAKKAAGAVYNGIAGANAAVVAPELTGAPITKESFEAANQARNETNALINPESKPSQSMFYSWLSWLSGTEYKEAAKISGLKPAPADFNPPPSPSYKPKRD